MSKTIKETKRRSIMKTISWRICATTTTMLIVYIFTRRLELSLGVGLVEAVSKMILYYFHERAWGATSWGCIKHPLSQISLKGELKPQDLSIIRSKLKDLGYID